MVLKRVEIFGFKSFPDRTVLDFPEGITAIVGSNGCGKSNVSDAIRWVLGEQSAKQLRGDRMEDLIFAGTSTRKPMNVAEVVLTFDNTHKLFPLEFNEVSIGRRLFRNGDSSYLLNKKECRLRDVHDLMMDSGIGRRVHAIIEQGKIDEIVTAKPEERRGIIEEAAGIAKYRSRRSEALRRLEATRDGLRRVDDLILEMERQEAALHRQAKKAERYREIETELRSLDLAHASMECLTLNEKITEALAEKTKIEEALVQLEAETATLSLVCETSKFDLDASRGRAKENAVSLTEAERAYSAAESQLAELKARQGDDEKSLARITDEIDILGRSMAEAENDHREAISSSEILSCSVAELIRSRIASVDRAATAGIGLSLLRNDLEDLTRRRRIHLDSSLQSTSEITFLEKSTAELEIRVKDGLAQIEKFRGEREKLEKLQAQYADEGSELALARDCAWSEETGITERTLSLESEAGTLEAECHRLDREIAVAASRHAAATARARAVEEELAASSLAQSLGLSPVSAAFEKESEFTAAFVSAFGEALDGIVLGPDCNFATPDESADQQREVAKLQSGPLERVAMEFRGRTIFSSSSCPPVSGVWIPRDDLKALRSFLPPNSPAAMWSMLTGWYLAENVVEARAALAWIDENERVVTVDGDVHYPFGAMKKSRLDQTDDMAAGRQSLALALEALRADHESLATRLFENGKNTIAAEAERTGLQSRIREIDARRNHLALLVSGIAERLAADPANSGARTIEIEEMKNDRDARSIRLEDARADQLRNKESAAALTRVIVALEALIESAAAEHERLRAASSEIEMEEGRARERHAARLAEVDRLSGWAGESGKTMVRYREMLNEIAVRKDRLVIVIADLEVGVGRLAESLERARQSWSASETETADKAARLLVDEDHHRRLMRGREEQVNGHHAAEMEMMKLVSERGMIESRIRERYGVDVPVVDSKPAAIDAARLEELREALSRMSAVNFAAAEELDELNKRLEFYRTQRNDLTQAETGLVDVVGDIDRRTVSLFTETFRAVNNNFSLLFNRLFGSREGMMGSAELVLLDPDNPLESGIDIIAMPPGKKPQTISLLSGGEKALTAVSLLFSVFLVRPSPFAILDELDAPLDEANVGKYVQLLREFSQRTQFIIVTHNKRTMEAADTLYGVTQTEKGISNILGVRLAEADVIPEAAG